LGPALQLRLARSLVRAARRADAIVVTGFFNGGTAAGKKLAFSYTGLLVRQNGELRIRLEDESADPKTMIAPKGSGRN